LQPVAPLRPRAAAGATAYFDIEAAHNRPSHDVFLILGRNPLHLYCAATGTMARQRRLQHFIHTLRHGPEGRLAVVAAALTPGRFGFRFRLPLGKGRGLAMDGATRLLQILLQPLAAPL